MSHGNPASLPWVWDWLTGRYPGAFGVPQTIQPVLDVARHTGHLELYRESFTLATGTNSIVLPGQNRAASLNPGTTPIPQGTSARRWLGLSVEIDTTIANSVSFLLKRGSQLRWAFWQTATINGSTVYPVIRGQLFGSTLIRGGFNGSIIVFDPQVIICSVVGAAGGESLTLAGALLDAEDNSEPLPDLFSP